MSIQGDVDTWMWQVKHRLHQLNAQTEVGHNNVHLGFPVYFSSLFLKRFVTSVLSIHVVSSVLSTD